MVSLVIMHSNSTIYVNNVVLNITAIPPLICPLVHIADIEMEVKVVTKAESKIITDEKAIPA